MAAAKKTTTKKATAKETKTEAPVVENKAEEIVEKETASEAAPVYQVVAPKDPVVKILYIDSAIDKNEIKIGRGRSISGSGRVFSVRLAEFEGEFMTPVIMSLIDQRTLIILDGLTDEQREQYHCLYKEGEVLKKEGMFDFLISCDTEKAVEIFTELCKEHRTLVGRRFLEAWDKGDNRITRDKVEALNKISKENYEDNTGIFTPIVKAFAERV